MILIRILLSAALLLVPVHAWAVISGTSNICSVTAAAGATSVACTMPGNTTAGNFIVCGIAAESLTEANWTGLSDGTTSGTGRATSWVSGSFGGMKIYDIQNITSLTTPTLTGSFSTSLAFRGIVCREYSGVATSGAFDQADPNFQASVDTTANAVTTGPLTNTTADSLIFACTMNQDDANTVTAGTGYTEIAEPTTGFTMECEQQIVSSAASRSATWTRDAGAGGMLNTMAIYAQASAVGDVEGCYLLENNSDFYLMENSTDKYTLEGGDGSLCGGAVFRPTRMLLGVGK
jgi:hypothetical protein